MKSFNVVIATNGRDTLQRMINSDGVQIFHPHGTGYNISEASKQMSMYVDSLNDHNFVEFLRSAL